MWITIISIALIVSSTVDAQAAGTAPNQCVQQFDSGFRKCFMDIVNLNLEAIFYFVTNGNGGKLTPNQQANIPALKQNVCGSREGIINCIRPLTSNQNPVCQSDDIGMMEGTVDSMVGGLGNLCGVEPDSTPPQQCLQTFDKGFRECLQKLQILPDNFFKLLANQDLPANVNKDQLKQKSCSKTTKDDLMKCSTTIVAQLQKDCKPKQTIVVGTTLQNMLSAYESVCTGKSVNPNQCMTSFENGMNQCAQQTLKMDMQIVLMVLNNQTLPPGQDATALKKQICSQWHNLENCGKNAVANAGCQRMQLLSVEATFANMMITTATFCGDTSLPGACLLTLQKQFGECFGKVGLSPQVYLGNKTEHKGALIGSNTAEANEYCAKKHDLFTCMQEVMHKCPGAEQTLSLTGFDLHGMERAVGKLCHDIPRYLDGLICFESPTDMAKECMDNMTMAITELSTKQITQKLSMDSFFEDFCKARVEHVGCDARAWPTCNKAAVNLKNEFECELIPSRCHNSHRNNVEKICPNTEVYIPGGDTKMHLHEVPRCAQDISYTMNNCFSKHGLEPDMFLVNITHDRSNFIGDEAKARSLCQSRQDVFMCMRNALQACPAAADVLSFWGHQQSALEGALNIVCNELPLYTKGHGCFENVNSQVQRCVTNTESKMLMLADKQVQKKMSPDAYFRDFCTIRIEHLKCDLNGWGSVCSSDVLGLKTEYECRLIQQHCRNLQVSNFKTICNDQSYAKAQRVTGTGGTGTGPGGAAGSISASVAAVFTSLIFALLIVL